MSSQPDLEKIRSEMIACEFPILFDYLDPRSSHLLNTTLSDYLPHTNNEHPYERPRMPSTAEPALLPPAHHLVYFPPNMPDSKTLPDGTDPNQSPGKPFTRRMWAGGEVNFHNDPGSSLKLDGSKIACVERIADLAIKGHQGSEKLFVKMERLIGRCSDGESDSAIRQRLENGDGVAINEVRNIFFSRPISSEQKSQGSKPIKPQHQAEFSHTFTPTAKLLFRYSALTFNTHAIHRDIKFCQEVEHYPDLIFHGPLSFTFLTTFLRHELARQHPKAKFDITSVRYRNTHPLYNEQPVKLCGCKTGDDEYELWEETPAGNVAVQYSATVQVTSSRERYVCQDLLDYGLLEAA